MNRIGRPPRRIDMGGDEQSRPIGRGAERGEWQWRLPALAGIEASASVPVSLRASAPIIPPAFLDDYDEEGSEWGWSDWDRLDGWDIRELIPRP